MLLLLHMLGTEIAAKRKSLRMSQSELALKTGISRSTLDLLENGRARELGFSKVSRILSALGMELKTQEANLQRPTLEDLLEEKNEEDLQEEKDREGRMHGRKKMATSKKPGGERSA